jgi:soluble lytic murein transglycosylase-like protein
MKHKINIESCEIKFIAIVLAALLGGGAIGFAIGRRTAPSEEAPTESVVETTPPKPSESEVVAVPSKPEKVYYDCPLDKSLQNYIRGLCERNDIPMSLVIAMIEVESSFQPDAVSGTDDYGLMQINGINHEWLTEEYGITDFFDPYYNVFCGIKILSIHWDRYKDIDKSLMAYNLGATGASEFWDEGIYSTEYTRKIRIAQEKYKKNEK